MESLIQWGPPAIGPYQCLTRRLTRRLIRLLTSPPASPAGLTHCLAHHLARRIAHRIAHRIALGILDRHSRGLREAIISRTTRRTTIRHDLGISRVPLDTIVL